MPAERLTVWNCEVGAGLVRIGIAPYNTKDELEKVIDALKQI